MTRQLIITPLLLLGLAGTLTASAAEGERPCREDVMKHCGDHMGNREGMRSCMREKFGQFSEQCKAAIINRQQQGQGQHRGQGQKQGDTSQ